MKKIILFMLVVFMIIPSRLVYAEELEKYVYSIDFFAIYKTYNANGNKYAQAVKAHGTIESDYIILGYRDANRVKLLLYNPDGTLYFGDCGMFMSNLSQHTTTTGYSEGGYAYWSSGEFDKENYADKYWESNVLTGQLDWDKYDYLSSDNPGYLNTNIPIFLSIEECNKYISGELTEKDAVNYESDLCKIVYDLETPKDVNVDMISGDDSFSILSDKISIPQMYINWKQDDTNYVNWDTEFYIFEDFKYRASIGIVSFEKWDYVTDFYIGVDRVSTSHLEWNRFHKFLSLGSEKKEEAYPTWPSGEYEPLVWEIYMRNAYMDDDGIMHYSNWVIIKYDFKSGNVDISFKEIAGSEIESDDNGNFQRPTGVQIEDSQYTDDYKGAEMTASTDLLSYISSGFGMLGDNGVIAMLSDAFSYMPSFFWVILGAGLAIMVVIGVAKFVF